MKKITTLLICAFCVILTGCDKEDAVLTTLTIIKADVNVKATGGEAVIEIQAASQIQATSDVDWCKVVESTTEKVKLAVEANTGYPGRTAQIIITDGTHTQQVTLIQEGAVLIYNKNELVQYTDNKAAILPIEIASSFPIQVDIPAKNKEWLSFEIAADGKSGVFKVKENKTGDIRGSKVLVTSGDRQLDYQVLQYDAENFLGDDWKGLFQSGGKTYGLPSVSIEKSSEEGVYVISGIYPAEGYDYKLKATYKDQGFSIAAGQSLGMYSLTIQGMTLSFNAYFCVLDQNSLPNWTSNYQIGLVPILLPDDSFVLAFIDNGGVPGGIATGFTITAFRGIPSNNSFVTHIQGYFNCFFYKENAADQQ